VTGSRVEYRVYDTTTWDLLHRVPRANAAGVGPVAFSGDGSALAVVVSAGSVGLFDADCEHERALLPVSRHDPVAGLRFSRDGAWLAIGTESGLIHLWDLRRVRDRLRRLGLDWEPPLPAADAQDDLPPLKVEVEERPGR
jgi:WD40 repeat protein